MFHSGASSLLLAKKTPSVLLITDIDFLLNTNDPLSINILSLFKSCIALQSVSHVLFTDINISQDRRDTIIKELHKKFSVSADFLSTDSIQCVHQEFLRRPVHIFKYFFEITQCYDIILMYERVSSGYYLLKCKNSIACLGNTRTMLVLDDPVQWRYEQHAIAIDTVDILREIEIEQACAEMADMVVFATQDMGAWLQSRGWCVTNFETFESLGVTVDIEQDEKSVLLFASLVTQCLKAREISPSPRLHGSPLVSVVIPTFNRPRLLPHAVRSALEQTWQHIEVIIVNDGSTDPCVASVLESLSYDDRVRVISQSNAYLGVARNTGIDAARGEYIVFLDDDNRLCANFVETTLGALISLQVDILTVGMCAQDSEKNQFAWLPGGGGSDCTLPLMACIENFFGDACSLVRKDVFSTIRFATRYKTGYEDWALFLDAKLCGLRIGCLPLPLFLYAVDSNSMLQTTARYDNFHNVWDVLHKHGKHDIQHLLEVWCFGAKTRTVQKSAPLPLVGERVGIVDLLAIPFVGKWLARCFPRSIEGEFVAKDPTPRICITSHDASRTGAALIVLNFCREMVQRKGVSCLFLLGEDGPLANDFRALGPTWILPSVFHYSQAPDAQERAQCVSAALAQYTICFAICNSGGSWQFFEGLDRLGITYILLYHEYVFPITEWEAKTFKNVCEIVTPAQDVRDQLLKALPTHAQISICPQGLYFADILTQKPLVTRDQLLAGCHLPDNAFVVLSVGYACARKGIHVFAALAQELAHVAQDLPIYLVWLGKENGMYGEGFDSIERMSRFVIHCAEMEDRVVFAGEQKDVSSWYHAADCLFLASIQDPFPSVVLEAMAAAKPVICFDKGTGSGDAVRTDAGYIVPYLDVCAVAKKIIHLYYNPDVAYDMGEIGRSRIKDEFDYSRYVDTIWGKVLGHAPNLKKIFTQAGVTQSNGETI